VTLLLVKPRIRFPARCARCGQLGPRFACVLRLAEGAKTPFDILDQARRIDVPACGSCWCRLGLILWAHRLVPTLLLVGASIACVAFLGGLGLLLATIPLGLALTAVVLAPVFEGGVHARFGDVWASKFHPASGLVHLEFRDPRFESETAALSAGGPGDAYQAAIGASLAWVLFLSVVADALLLWLFPPMLEVLRALDWSALETEESTKRAVAAIVIVAMTPMTVLGGPVYALVRLRQRRR